MFGLFKPKLGPEGPVRFELAMAIDRPAGEVFPLLDYADPRNAKRALGSRIERIASAPERYLMELDLLPDHVIELTVTEDKPGELYAFEAAMRPPVGRLVSSHEAYEVESVNASSCVLRLTVTATFVAGMRQKTYSSEIATMMSACHNALAKLKIHAEQGVDAVREIEAMQMA